jgi:hypothetical protein
MVYSGFSLAVINLRVSRFVYSSTKKPSIFKDRTKWPLLHRAGRVFPAFFVVDKVACIEIFKGRFFDDQGYYLTKYKIKEATYEKGISCNTPSAAASRPGRYILCMAGEDGGYGRPLWPGSG